MIIKKLDDCYVVKIFKNKLENFDAFNKSCIEELFQEILKNLLKKYPIHGLIDVEIYYDPLYGMIIELREIYDYFEEINLRIHFHLDCVFLVEVEESVINTLKDIYYYQGKYYKTYDRVVDSPIIYKDSECIEIMEKGIRL